ncbi:MAG: CooT family nickel-binding protein [Candidatus Bathyarchaeota archaeon]
MCLLKIYLDTGSERKLIAKEIAFLTNEKGKVKFSNVHAQENTLDNVDVSAINAMNSEVILKPQS